MGGLDFRGFIPRIGFDEKLIFDFDLSFYDLFFFRIQRNSAGDFSLFYFVFDEIMVYTGDYFEDYGDGKVFLGRDKRILVSCSENGDLLRFYPNDNKRIILDQCIENSFICPSIPGCAFCVSEICEYCKKNYIKVGNTCVLCLDNQVLSNNICYETSSLNITEISTLFNALPQESIVVIKYNLESLSNSLEITSTRNNFYNTLYYSNFINNTESEKPSHILNLINFDNYISTTLQYKIFTELQNSKNYNISYPCKTSEYFEYNQIQNFSGECKPSCLTKYQKNNYCVEPIYSCLQINPSKNRCSLCNPNYSPILFDSNIYSCSPKSIETQFIDKTENEIIY